MLWRGGAESGAMVPRVQLDSESLDPLRLLGLSFELTYRWEGDDEQWSRPHLYIYEPENGLTDIQRRILNQLRHDFVVITDARLPYEQT